MTSILRVATFNLESLDDAPGAPVPLERRIEVLRPQLVRLNADILCLQEVNGQHPPGGGPRELRALERLLDGTAYADFHRAETARVSGAEPKPGEARGADAVHNLVILSRYPLREVRELRQDLVQAPVYRTATADPPADSASPVLWDRPALCVTADIPGGRPLHLVNLHLRAPLAAPVPGGKSSSLTWKSVSAWAEGFFLANVKRSGQALEVRLMIDAWLDADPDALIAVIGDFNAQDRETPLRIVGGDIGDTGNPDLATRSLHSLASLVPEARRFSVIHAGRPEMLDHVLVSRSLFGRAQGMEVDNASLEDELSELSGASHHVPLLARFELG